MCLVRYFEKSVERQRWLANVLYSLCYSGHNKQHRDENDRSIARFLGKIRRTQKKQKGK